MKTNISRAEGLRIAHQIIELIRPACQRIEIAGSLRRNKAEVGDVDLLAIPLYEPEIDLVGGMIGHRLAMDRLIHDYDIPIARQGATSRVLVLEGYPVDIFFADAATWGVRLALRTGSSDFSHWLVTSNFDGGALPCGYRVRDGRLWSAGRPLDTPEESDLFRALGLGWIPPEQRKVGRWPRREKGVTA